MSAIYPPGIILPYAGPAANLLNNGWLLCDGSSISRTSYKDLYDVILTTYGADDEGTFKLPDLRGRVVAGLETMSNTTPPVPPPSPSRLSAAVYNGVNGSILGGTGGAQSHQLLSTESGIAPHAHLTYASTLKTEGGGSGARVNALAYEANDSTGQTGPIAQNASQAHNNVQPTIVLNYFIKI